MSKIWRRFDEAAKSRIMSSEAAKHGRIRPDSFASYVQGLVDKSVMTPRSMAGTAKIKK